MDFKVFQGGATTSRLLWIDLETTGLNFSKDKILEIAALVTDSNLEELASFNVVIHYDDHEIQLEDWSQNQHSTRSKSNSRRNSPVAQVQTGSENEFETASGTETSGTEIFDAPENSSLLEDVKTSQITFKDATKSLQSFIDAWRENKKMVLAGSSINFDKMFLQFQMPDLCDCLHYRSIDVSSIMELAKRWNPQLHPYSPKPSHSHRAMDDILSSLELLRFYKQFFFTPNHNHTNNQHNQYQSKQKYQQQQHYVPSHSPHPPKFPIYYGSAYNNYNNYNFNNFVRNK